MNKIVTVLVAASVLSALVSAIPGARSYELARHAKEGDSAKYQIGASFQFQGRTATMEMDQTERVLRVKEDGSFEVETSASNCKLVTDGKEQAIPDDAPTSCVYDRLGALLTIHEASPDGTAYRKANMLAFIAPERAVKIGDKWMREFKPDSESGMQAARSTFVVESEERVGSINAVKVKFAFEETSGSHPIASNGHAWVSTGDGSLLKLDASFKNFPMGAGAQPVDGTFRMNRE